MTSDMELVVDAGGGIRCIYDETLDLWEIGKLQITIGWLHCRGRRLD